MVLREHLKKYIAYDEQEQCDKERMLKCMDDFEDIFSRENLLCHFTASSWIVNKERTKVLMIYHNIYKSWAWTGGHADGEVDLEKVALKEAKEETGLQNVKIISDGIYAVQILTVDSHWKKGKFVPAHLHLDCCFLMEADEEDAIRIKEDENSNIGWIEISQTTCVTSEEKMKPIYKKLNEKLRGVN